MNLDEINTTIDLHYPVDSFTEWTPSEYEMKYHYNTPRKQKKIQKDKEKYDEKSRKKITYQETDKLNLKELCRRISVKLPVDVSSLFFETIRLNMTDLLMKHQDYLEKCEQLKNKYYIENDPYCVYNYTYYLNQCIDKTIKHVEVIDYVKFCDKFKDVIKMHPNLCTEAYANELLLNYKEYELARSEDTLLRYINVSDGKRHALKYIIEKLYTICQDICQSLDNKEITGWERESSWGVGGYYNGILKNIDNKRVSFKSFMAGGYNIQRRHIRYRLTILKNN